MCLRMLPKYRMEDGLKERENTQRRIENMNKSEKTLILDMSAYDTDFKKLEFDIYLFLVENLTKNENAYPVVVPYGTDERLIICLSASEGAAQIVNTLTHYLRSTEKSVENRIYISISEDDGFIRAWLLCQTEKTEERYDLIGMPIIGSC